MPFLQMLTSSFVFLLQLDIAFDGVSYKDTLEWDVLNPPAAVEKFAKLTVADLGLPREFETIITVEMQRQIYFHLFRSAYDEAAAWDRGLLSHNYWMEQLPSWAAIRPLEGISAFQPTLRPLPDSPSVAASSVQETLRNALPASTPNKSAIDDALAAQYSADTRKLQPLTLPAAVQTKRTGPTPVIPDPIPIDQQALFTAELVRIMGPLTRRRGGASVFHDLSF